MRTARIDLSDIPYLEKYATSYLIRYRFFTFGIKRGLIIQSHLEGYIEANLYHIRKSLPYSRYNREALAVARLFVAWSRMYSHRGDEQTLDSATAYEGSLSPPIVFLPCILLSARSVAYSTCY